MKKTNNEHFKLR